MEVVLGLLILIGTMLEGAEGLRCYQTAGNNASEATDCPAAATACLKVTAIVNASTCLPMGSNQRQCLDKEFGRRGKCVDLSNQKEAEKYTTCASINGRSIPQNTTGFSLPNLKNPLNRVKIEGRTSKSGDRSLAEICFCYTDLCNGDTVIFKDPPGPNPAGRSTPSAQVILAILLAASLYAFSIGLGSL